MNEPSYAWRYKAGCSGEDTDLFYPPRDKDLYKPIADAAKSFCFGGNGRPACPVRKECLWDAMRREELHGIWGGMSHRERNALYRKWKRQYSDKFSLEVYVKDIV